MKMFFILLLSLAIHSQNTEKPVLKIGAISYPPFFNFQKDSAVTGIGVDRVEKILGKIFKLEWREVPISRGEIALNTDLIDIYTAHSIVGTNRRKISYSKMPYIILHPQVCGTNTQPFSEDLHELKGKSILYPNGSHMIDRFKNLNIKVMPIDYSINYIDKGIKLLKLKRSDYFFCPTDHFLKDLSENHPEIICHGIGENFNAYITAKLGSEYISKIDELMEQQASQNLITFPKEQPQTHTQSPKPN